MKTGEQKVWTKLSTIMKEYVKSNWHATRIETGATALGQPDVNYALFGVENDIELKYSHTVKEWCRLRPAQYQWMKKRARAGKLCWIIVHSRGSDQWMILSSKHAEYLIKNPNYGAWLGKATKVWHKDIKPNELAEILEHGKIKEIE